MPTYLYTTKDATGAQQYGYRQAKTADALTTHLHNQGLVVSEVEQVSSGKRVDLSLLCLQLSVLIRAEIPTAECLSIAAEHVENKRLSAILQQVSASVASGTTLTESLSKYPTVFDAVFIAMIDAGERGQVLPEVLQRLSMFIKLGAVKRRRTASMLTFSASIAALNVACVLAYTVFVLPRFIQLFSDMGIRDYPAVTLFVITLFSLLTTKWYLCVSAPAALWAAAKLCRTSPKMALISDTLALKMPILGKIKHRRAISNFSRTLGMLLASGVTMDSALETSAGAASNRRISREVLNARTRISKGAGVAEAFGHSKHFPQMVVEVIGAGEQHGALDFTLAGLADAYDQESESRIAFYSTFLEVGLFLVFGVSLLLMAAATFIPIVPLNDCMCGDSDNTGGKEGDD